MNQERILRQIPKQRRPQEHYTQPWPLPESTLDELLASADIVLEHIDEAVEE